MCVHLSLFSLKAASLSMLLLHIPAHRVNQLVVCECFGILVFAGFFAFNLIGKQEIAVCKRGVDTSYSVHSAPLFCGSVPPLVNSSPEPHSSDTCSPYKIKHRCHLEGNLYTPKYN